MISFQETAQALAAEALTLAGETGRAVCFCGPGNNGGDGIAWPGRRPPATKPS